MFTTGKTFAAAGWTPAAGAMLRSMGSSDVAWVLLDVPGATWRLRAGGRVAVLERRAHGTPTGRCSAGHWQRIDEAPTPRKARDWGRLAKLWAALAREHATSPEPLDRHSRGDVNRCGTRAASDGDDESRAGARGRAKPHIPSRLHAFGHAPASGFRLLPDAVEQRRARKRRRNQRRKAQRAAKARRIANGVRLAMAESARQKGA